MMTLLIGKICVFDRRDPVLICSAQQNAPQFGLGGLASAGQDQRSVAEVDERHLTATIDAPAVTQLSGQARLSAV